MARPALSASEGAAIVADGPEQAMADQVETFLNGQLAGYEAFCKKRGIAFDRAAILAAVELKVEDMLME